MGGDHASKAAGAPLEDAAPKAKGEDLALRGKEGEREEGGAGEKEERGEIEDRPYEGLGSTRYYGWKDREEGEESHNGEEDKKKEERRRIWLFEGPVCTRFYR